MFRPPVLIGGALISLAFVWAQADMRTVVSDVAVHGRNLAEITSMDPQNPDEFRHDWNRAMEIVAQNPTIYTVDFQVVLNNLTTRPLSDGRYASTRARKSWATDLLRSDAWMTYNMAGISGYFDHGASSHMWDPGYMDAYGMVHGRWYLLLAKMLSSFSLGGGIIWGLMLILPYLLLVLGLLSVLACGKLPVAFAPHTTPTIITATQHVQPSPIAGDMPVAIGPHVVWPILLVLVAVCSVGVAASVAAPVLTLIRGRAPPTHQELHMRRSFVTVTLLLCSLFAFTSSAFAATHTASLYGGEWAAGQGSMYSYSLESGRLLLNPTVTSNGTCLDLFTRYDLLPSPSWTLGVGTSVGVLEHTAGTEAYVGPTVKFGWAGRGFSLSAAGNAYHSRTRTIMDAGTFNAAYTTGPLTIGGGLEPVRYTRHGAWIHRSDLNAAWAFSAATVTVEGRVETNNHNRSSASIVVDVPFTLPAKK